MTSKQKISLAIPAFLMAMVGDYLIGYEPWDIEPLGPIADTGWLTIADWRIALSNLLGAIAVPLYFIAAREFLRLLEARNPKGKNKGIDRFLWLFRVGNYAGFLSFVFIHIACGLLILQFNAAYEVIGNADAAMGLDRPCSQTGHSMLQSMASGSSAGDGADRPGFQRTTNWL